MIVDFHTHIFSPEVCRNRDPWFEDAPFSLIYRNPSAKLADHPALLSAMDDAGVDMAIAMGFPWTNPEFCRRQNEYLQHAAYESGGRIVPFGSIPMSANQDIEQWMDDIAGAGMRGVGEIAFYGEGITDESLSFLNRVLSSAVRHDLPVCIHVNEPVGHQYPGKYEPRLDAICEVIAKTPAARIILSHWGGGLCFYELMPEVRASLSSCYYDTAATPFLYREDIYRVGVEIAGADRILFGSDFPLCHPSRYMDAIARALPRLQDKSSVLGGNAIRILGLS